MFTSHNYWQFTAINCPENSLCGPYGPGFFECSCADNYHGYKCLREVSSAGCFIWVIYVAISNIPNISTVKSYVMHLLIVNRASSQFSRCLGLLEHPQSWSQCCCGSHKDGKPNHSEAEQQATCFYLYLQWSTELKLTVLKGKMLTQSLKWPQALFKYFMTFTPLWGRCVLFRDILKLTFDFIF